MLPIVDKPTIQYVVEEAVASGITDVIIVTGRGKSAIEDHFDRSFELELVLSKKGKHDLLEEVRRLSELVSICYIRQKEPLGLGHAVLVARNLVGDEPFAVLLGDNLIDSNVPCLKQLMAVYEKYRCSVLGVHRISKEEISSYGVIEAKPVEDRIYQITDMVEKPDPGQAPSELAIIGRYILTPEIFPILEETPPDRGGEIQLTDGLRKLLQRQVLYGMEFEGKQYDAGSKLGFLKATVEYALRRPDIATSFKEYIRGLDLDTL
jgi:UTP--glucose-1-phosphate uridylyltransferase